MFAVPLVGMPVGIVVDTSIKAQNGQSIYVTGISRSHPLDYCPGMGVEANESLWDKLSPCINWARERYRLGLLYSDIKGHTVRSVSIHIPPSNEAISSILPQEDVPGQGARWDVVHILNTLPEDDPGLLLLTIRNQYIVGPDDTVGYQLSKLYPIAAVSHPINVNKRREAGLYGLMDMVYSKGSVGGLAPAIVLQELAGKSMGIQGQEDGITVSHENGSDWENQVLTLQQTILDTTMGENLPDDPGEWDFFSSQDPIVTIGMTTCKRLSLFTRTMNALLPALGYPHPEHGIQLYGIIHSFLVVDDQSTAMDRVYMLTHYPHLMYIFKDKGSVGHAASLNILMRMVHTRYYKYVYVCM